MKFSALFQRSASSVQRLVIFSFFLFSTFYLLPSVAHANTNSDVPNNPHFSTQSTVIEIMSAITCQLSGIDPINPKQPCLGVDQKTGKIGFVQNGGLPAEASAKAGGGAIGLMGNMISMLYTPPLHTSDYFQNLAQNFGITKHAFAQTGTGFEGLKPLLGLWTAFRNIAYLVFVIVFIVIGLAIMLRVKIDPRTVMTIQNQIPKIIIGILLVTFSYAIAGFLIDLMWVFIYLIYGIFSGIPGVNLDNFNPANIQGQNALRVAGHISNFGIFGITSNAAGSAKDALGSILHIDQCVLCVESAFNPLKGLVDIANPIDTGVANWLIDIISYGAGALMFFNISHIPTDGDIWGISTVLQFVKNLGAIPVAYGVFAGTESMLRIGLPWIIAYVIIFIALLAALFRLWFTLIMAYVQILLAVVLAPFWIIGGIVPGSPISFSGWIRNISANLLAFPVTIAMFMLGKVFMDAFGCDIKVQTCKDALAHNFVPPLIGNAGDPSLIGSLIGLGIILMTPNVVNMLKTALKAPKIDTSGVGKAIGGVVGAPMELFNKAGALGLSLGGISGLGTGLKKLPILNKMRGGTKAS